MVGQRVNVTQKLRCCHFHITSESPELREGRKGIHGRPELRRQVKLLAQRNLDKATKYFVRLFRSFQADLDAAGRLATDQQDRDEAVGRLV